MDAVVSMSRFNLAIERLFISGYLYNLHSRLASLVSISQSRGFSFQVRYEHASRLPAICFNLAIERLFISGYRLAGRARLSNWSFNLAIERLFISGGIVQENALGCQFQSRNREAFHFRRKVREVRELSCLVSISQSRGFSFQVYSAHRRG